MLNVCLEKLRYSSNRSYEKYVIIPTYQNALKVGWRVGKYVLSHSREIFHLHFAHMHENVTS